MNIFLDHYEFLKNEAELLLKHAGNGDASAQDRLRSHLPAGETPKLKHALHAIAEANSYASWDLLKQALDGAAELSPLAEIKDQFYPKGFTTYWNIWFAKYAQAKKTLSEGKGYLLPFRNQFFIVEEHFVDSIGVPHTLPEWEAIGRDWVHPRNVKAWLTLNERYAAAIKERPSV